MTRLAAALLGAALAAAAPIRAAPPAPYVARPEVHAFVRDLVERHGFVERELVFLFKRARRDSAVLRAIAAATDPRARSWRDYRARFVNRTRIGDGLEFRRREAAALERAAREHGIPEEILVAIIGVESLYGRQMGAHRVVDALTTLAFDHPARAEFFRSELEQYLLYARDAQIDVFSVRGSYAGAIGIPQFMPGSVRRYAVDFDGDGTIELRTSASDAIGSVANFLAKHGWRRGEAVALPARVNGNAHRAMLEAGIEPKFRLQDLKQYGVETRTGLALETAVALIELDTPGAAPEFRLGLRNFWVLTRYNRSSFYAAAVIDLAGALRAERHGSYDGGR